MRRTSNQGRSFEKKGSKSCYSKQGSSNGSLILVTTSCSGVVTGNDKFPSLGRVYISDGIVHEPCSLTFSRSTAGPQLRLEKLLQQYQRLRNTIYGSMRAWSVNQSSQRHIFYCLQCIVSVLKLSADICGLYQARHRAMISAEAKVAAIAHVQRKDGAGRFGWVGPDGVLVLPLLMAKARLAFIGELSSHSWLRSQSP